MRTTTPAAVYAAALLPLAAIAQTPSPETVYKAAGARASRPTATIAYGRDPLQVADLRLPSGPRTTRTLPVAVVVHGGCWSAGVDSRAGIAAFADALGRRGFATWTIGYRRIGDAGGGWPGTFADVAAAVDKLPSVARAHRLDMRRVTLIGHSSGGHLALWAASRAKLPAPWSRGALRPASVVAVDAPASLAPFVGIDAQVCGRPVIVPLMGGTPADKPAEYALASPAAQLPLGVRQLSVSAEFRPFMKPYEAAARASGDTVVTLEPAQANHFDIVTPGLPNGEAVADFIAANAFTAPVVRR